jgi:hypothetical protein
MIDDPEVIRRNFSQYLDWIFADSLRAHQCRNAYDAQSDLYDPVTIEFSVEQNPDGDLIFGLDECITPYKNFEDSLFASWLTSDDQIEPRVRLALLREIDENYQSVKSRSVWDYLVPRKDIPRVSAHFLFVDSGKLQEFILETLDIHGESTPESRSFHQSMFSIGFRPRFYDTTEECFGEIEGILDDLYGAEFVATNLGQWEFDLQSGHY